MKPDFSPVGFFAPRFVRVLVSSVHSLWRMIWDQATTFWEIMELDGVFASRAKQYLVEKLAWLANILRNHVTTYTIYSAALVS